MNFFEKLLWVQITSRLINVLLIVWKSSTKPDMKSFASPNLISTLAAILISASTLSAQSISSPVVTILPNDGVEADPAKAKRVV